MRIGFDARILTSPKCGGSNCLSQLVYHLPRIDATIEIVLFFPKAPLAEYEEFITHPRVTMVVVPEAEKFPDRWPAKYLPKLLKEQGIDIFHQPFNADGPFFRVPCRMVVTILDLIPWLVKGIFRKRIKEWRYKLRNIIWAHRADAIVTISEASKNDIVKLCRVSPDKVAVTHLGADPIFSGDISPKETEDILCRLGLAGKKYIINMGGLNQQRRHPDFILEGFGQYLRSTKDDCFLVFTGSVLKQGGFFERVQAKIEAEGIKERVIIAGFLSDKDLKVVLSRAQVSVMTSLYEGFCLPLTESFACGVPSIANDRGSIPEIAADAAILVDPFKPGEFAERLAGLMREERLRNELRAKGLERVKAFQWENTAHGTLRVYQALMRRSKKEGRP